MSKVSLYGNKVKMWCLIHRVLIKDNRDFTKIQKEAQLYMGDIRKGNEIIAGITGLKSEKLLFIDVCEIIYKR